MGCVRLVYNKALAARTEAWYERQERVGYSQTSSMLTGWKKEKELDFLNDVSCVPLQQGLRHLQTAFTNFFAGRAKYPNFKKKRSGGSAEFTKSAFKWKNGQVYIAKCKEPLPVWWSRQLPACCVPSTITVKLDPSGSGVYKGYEGVLANAAKVKAKCEELKGRLPKGISFKPQANKYLYLQWNSPVTGGRTSKNVNVSFDESGIYQAIDKAWKIKDALSNTISEKSCYNSFIKK